MSAFDAVDVIPPMPECWRRIGTSGDRSCRELERLVHCRNCPVLSLAARTLFDRRAPEGYLEEWTAILAESPQRNPFAGRSEPGLGGDSGPAQSVLVFKLEGEWFALPVDVLLEVTETRRVHTVPRRTGGALEGIVNIRGQLHLCLSLARLLRLPECRKPTVDLERLVVVEHEGDRWTFRVDQVAGVPAVPRDRLRAVPDTARLEAGGHTRALFDQDGRTVGLLDPETVFARLAEQVATDAFREPP